MTAVTQGCPVLTRVERIPRELTEQPRWVLWRYVNRPGENKPTKVPFTIGGKCAESNNPATWTTFEAAAAALAASSGRYEGLGFMLGDGYVGVDLDDSLRPDRSLKAWAAPIFRRLPTYWEVSPSGQGVKGFMRAVLPPKGRVTWLKDGESKPLGKVELYDAGRFFTVTGDQLEGTPRAIADMAGELAALHSELWPAPQPRQAPRHAASVTADDQKILDKARAAKTGAKFSRLWAGSTADYGGDDSSADQALCNLLAFWTGPDPRRIDALFRGSGLLRPKWDKVHYSDGRTYGEGTIDMALASTKQFYDWNRERQPRPEKKPFAVEPPEPYQAFPIHALPPVLGGYVSAAAKALGCDEAYVALPLLAEVAAAIGNSRRLLLKDTWAEPPILWCVVVAESGTLKSPAFDMALRFVRARQWQAMKDYEKAVAKYLTEKENFDSELKAWRKEDPATRGERPKEPEAPVCERLWCADTTVEALADRLYKAPRGLLVARDELAGWLGSFNQYKQRQGSDVPNWLEMHRGGPLMVDRKAGDKANFCVRSAAVCIAGGIQPETLRRCLTPEFYENGLAARLLLAMPPRRLKRWTDADVARETRDAVEKAYAELLELRPTEMPNGDVEPGEVRLSPEAKVLWVDFYNRHAIEQAGLGGDLAAAWSKLEAYAARFALVIHCVRQAAGEGVDPWVLDEQSMAAAIVLADWFGHEAKRAYRLLAETQEERDRRRLVELIQARGGRVTVRELSRCSRLYSGAAAWEKALGELAEGGVGRWHNAKPGQSGGHPVKLFELLTQPSRGDVVDGVDVDTTPAGGAEDGGSVNCQHVNTGAEEGCGDMPSPTDSWCYEDDERQALQSPGM